MQQNDQVIATYQPEKGDLPDDVLEWVGRTCGWVAVGPLDLNADGEDDGWAMAPVVGVDDPRPPMPWVPLSDLVEVEP